MKPMTVPHSFRRPGDDRGGGGPPPPDFPSLPRPPPPPQSLTGRMEAASNCGAALEAIARTIRSAMRVNIDLVLRDSILRRALNAVDDQEFARAFGWVELQSELLDHSEYGRRRSGIGRRC